jgi:hypothetical protein
MTAETITATRAAAGAHVFKGMGGGALCAAYGTTEIAAGNLLEAGDTINFCKIPAGAVVLGGYVYGDDLDTGTEALDIDFGWAANGVESADTDGFGNMGVITGDAVTEWKPVAGIMLPLQGLLLADGPKTFSAETTITGTVVAAANAGGTGTISLIVFYIVP